ncbi:MAG: hypothetical protein ACTSVU_06560 [Promethearchaeota archaeon]
MAHFGEMIGKIYERLFVLEKKIDNLGSKIEMQYSMDFDIDLHDLDLSSDIDLPDLDHSPDTKLPDLEKSELVSEIMDRQQPRIVQDSERRKELKEDLEQKDKEMRNKILAAERNS